MENKKYTCIHQFYMALLEYLKDANRFADLVNGTMFCGRQIVDPQYLTTIPRKKCLLLQNFSGKETGAT